MFKLPKKVVKSLLTTDYNQKFPITNSAHDRAILTSYAKIEFGKGYALFKPRYTYSSSKSELSSQSTQTVSTVFENDYKRKFDVDTSKVNVSNYDSLTNYYDDVESIIKKV